MLQLKNFPEIPVSSREEARESHHIQRSLVSASWLERRDPFTAWSGKNSRRSCRISRGGDLHRKGERKSRFVPPFPESARCLCPFQGNLFPCIASTFKPRIDSHHCGTWDSTVGKARGKASWERLVGKPLGKGTDPLIHAKGSVSLLLEVGRKGHVHAPTRDEY